jgi:pimeloyl-ACP methyl ester carboxylesterase
MKTCRLFLMWMTAVSLLAGSALYGQEITGTWQGTLGAEKKLRVVIQIEKSSAGTLTGKGYSIDQSPDPAPLTAISYTGSELKFTADTIHASYQGTMSPDGRTITGNLTQGKVSPLNFERATEATAWKIDPSPHQVQSITVEKEVRLEVLDWGGTGRPLVLLTGLGNNAHVFDKFAPKLTDKYHIYGITRRGFGASSKPSPETVNYTAGRLGEDVLAVIDALHLQRPVVAGHSVAGEELSYIGSRHPEKVAGLIYLDAGYPYALYDEVNGSLMLDSKDLRESLGQLQPGKSTGDQRRFMNDLHASLVRVEREVAQQQEETKDMPPPPPPPAGASMPSVGLAIIGGTQRFTTISAPALVIFASPKDFSKSSMFKDNPTAKAAMIAANNRNTERQAVAFERQVPSAHVVRIANADHYVFLTNEADVLREMNAFIATLP